MKRIFRVGLLASCILFHQQKIFCQFPGPVLQYTVSVTDPANHYFHVQLVYKNVQNDTVIFKMPQWMPGYYQIMNYGRSVENFEAKGADKKNLPVVKTDDHTWEVLRGKQSSFILSYDVKAEKKFVANSFVDSSHGYIIPEAIFVYIKDRINLPVSVKINRPTAWKNIATGLTAVNEKPGLYTAPDFDILYDCPILMGNLEELPSFTVKGVRHRFIGYQMGDFDKKGFMQNLQKVVQAATNIIGDIPYKEYTFIGIGPGQGGIEHLDNCTVSFNGKGLDKKEGMIRVMNFLAHEYFHHYNVKRIRPFELGPFDYEKGNKTNLLWISEGLSVYYEYLVVKRAGLISDEDLFHNFEHSLNAFENGPGKLYQSLAQASYETWSDGPFGRQGADADKSISYYDKGPLVGLLLDFEIRHATSNTKSLDDVMRQLYYHYYKELKRGFTDAEFQETCESVPGVSLTVFFEYVYGTKPLDYDHYLTYGGLHLKTEKADNNKIKYSLEVIENTDSSQKDILQSWLGE